MFSIKFTFVGDIWEICLNYSHMQDSGGEEWVDGDCEFSLGTISVFGKVFSVIYITLSIKTNIYPFILLFCFSSLARIHSYFGDFK